MLLVLGSRHFQMEAKTKQIKSKIFVTKSFYLQKKRSKRVHDEVVSLSNTYILTFIYIYI